MDKMIIGRTALALFVLLAAFPGARAEKELVDKVIAVVEDEAIFLSDLQQMVKQYLIQKGTAAASPAEKGLAEKQALEDLISNKLILIQARRLGLDVPFSEVEKNVESALEENKKILGSEEGFLKQLELEGLTLDKLRVLYREQIRNRMLIERVLASEIDRSKIEVSEKNLLERYEKTKNDFPKRPEVVHLATILFAFKTSIMAMEDAKLKMEKIYESVSGGMDFSQAARTYSEDPSAELGGDLGFLKLQDVQDENFAAAAESLEAGELSQPVLTRFGYHIIQVVERDAETDEVHLKHILVRVRPGEKDIERVFEQASEVHEILLAGAPFDSLAAIYSDEASSASSGGDLGWLKVQDLPEFFRDVMREMKPGDTSPVLRESAGFRIVKLLGREGEREYRFDEVKDELQRLLEQERMNSVYADYIESLREKFYVDIRQ